MEGTTYPRMNRVFLTGIAQEEPELRYTPSGVSVCSFRVQVGRILRDRSGGSREVAAYLTVVAWQEAAQRMSRELRKGQAIYVEGYVSSRSFTTARGDKRTAIEIYAEQIQILGPFPEEGQAEQGAADGAEESSPVPGGQRRGSFRRPDAPRAEPAREKPAETKREQPVVPAAGDASKESAAETAKEPEEKAATESEAESAGSSEQQQDSSSAESEGSSEPKTASGGEESETKSDETDNEKS